jgi:ethanolamine ammonia-lyase small subunit
MNGEIVASMVEAEPMNEITPHEEPSLSGLIAAVRARTPARIFVGRSGAAYRTRAQLELRADHASARDAVWAEVDLKRDLGDILEVKTKAASKEQYLLRPDLGRQLDDDSRAVIRQRCEAGVDLQVFVGDGLSAAAIAAQVPRLLPLLFDRGRALGWSIGAPFFVRHCRVGVLNDVGDLLNPMIAILLIGERPGLATAESLSAYLAYRPRSGDTDAKRNLISNIHARGVPIDEAAGRILALAERMRAMQSSGVGVKEERPGSKIPLGSREQLNDHPESQ